MLARLHRILGLASLSLVLTVSACRNDTRPSGPQPTRGDHLPNIILLTVDTLRADHIARYGYERNTMPSVERFADTAVVFDNAVVPRGLTRPSYASMLTGLYPYRHGVRTNNYKLHDNLVSVAEVLKSAGYHTAAFVSNFAMLEELSGLAQGFDVYDDRTDELMSGRLTGKYDYQRTAGNTAKAIMEWLASDPPEPFFLFVNFMDPHGPYAPPERFRKLYNTDEFRKVDKDRMPDYQHIRGLDNYYEYVDRYDGEIRYVDEAIGVLIDEFKEQGVWEDAFAVFTADHGECLGEHDIYFAHCLHVLEATVRVPMMIRLPKSSKHADSVKPFRTDALVSPMDLPPTLLAYLQLESDVDFDGINLMPVFSGGLDDRNILLECLAIRLGSGVRSDLYAVRSSTHKLVRSTERGSCEAQTQVVYDLTSDPLEANGFVFEPHLSSHHELETVLSTMLERVRDYRLPFKVVTYTMPYKDRPKFVRQRQATKTTVKKLTTQQAERLRGLGYLR